MKNVKWLFVVLLICSLTSFVEKDQHAGGLQVGSKAPDIHLQPMDAGQSMQTLSGKRGHKVLLSFWASYDAQSRLNNANLSYALNQVAPESVELVSLSLDTYLSICEETVRMDQIEYRHSYMELGGGESRVYKNYKLEDGFSNYLLDENGVIIAKNISVQDIPTYLN